MTGIIRISNIENYIQEIVNGELILTPKKKFRQQMNSEILSEIKKDLDIKLICTLLSIESEKYESKMVELSEDNPDREYYIKKIGIICKNRGAIQKLDNKKQYIELLL